jgi:hypothetical protein
MTRPSRKPLETTDPLRRKSPFHLSPAHVLDPTAEAEPVLAVAGGNARVAFARYESVKSL